jgi:D-alanyl-D-alanine carboxypeptidase
MNTNLPVSLSTRALMAAATELLEAATAPGAAVSLLVDGAPLVEAGLGFQDLARTTPLPHDARFYLYSVTKTLIAAALLQHVASSRLELDRPIQEYLPDLSLPAPVATRQLLNHSAALPDYGALPAYKDAVRQHPDQPWSVEQFLQVARQMESPAPAWHYSNAGYLILRLLLEKLSGRSLREALQEQLFTPLKLQHTFVAESLADAATLTPGYSGFFDPDGEPADMSGRYHPGWVAHGVVISTALETACLMHAILADDLLPRAQRAEMAEPVVLPFEHTLFQQPAYGLGVMIDAASPYGLLLGHAGGGPGYATAALCYPDVDGRSITAVALANDDASDLGLAIAHRLATAVAEELQG